MKSAKPLKVEISLFGDSRTLNSTKIDSELDVSLNRTQNLVKFTPTLTPNGSVLKMLERSKRDSSYSDNKENSNPNFRNTSRSPMLTRNHTTLDFEDSLNLTQNLHRAHSQRKNKEEEYTSMRNRIRKLQEENEKMKNKIAKTKRQKEMLLTTREQKLSDILSIEDHKKRLEDSLKKKKQKAEKMKYLTENNKREKITKLTEQKKAQVAEVKKQSRKNLELIEKEKKEEDIKKYENIWKVAINKKNAENARMYEKINFIHGSKTHYIDKLKVEENRAEEINKKIRALETVENELLNELRITFEGHMNAYSDMQNIYSSRGPSKFSSPTMNKTFSPFGLRTTSPIGNKTMSPMTKTLSPNGFRKLFR